MAKQLTENQKEIINQLKNEFLKINSEIQPTSSGLIDVAGIKQDIISKNKFIAECNAENLVNRRLIDKQVRADAEKLRSDLNELGLDVDYKDDGTCTCQLFIIKKGEIKKEVLMCINYNKAESQQIEKFGKTQYLNKGIKLSFNHGNTSFDITYCKTIEEMVKTSKFIELLKYNYEKINK